MALIFAGSFLRAAMCCAVTAFLLVVGGGVARADGGPNDEWNGQPHVDFTPFVWAPTINGTFNFHLSDITIPAGDAAAALDLTKTFSTSVGPNQYLANLNFAIMGDLQARIGNASLFFDFINVNIGSTAAQTRNINGPSGNLNYTIGSGAQVQFVATLATLDGTYTLYHGGNTNVDLLVGGRKFYTSVNANLTLTGTNSGGGMVTFSGAASRKVTLTTFVFGTMGQVGLTKKLSLPFYLDFGPGNISTSQGQVGLKYGNTVLSWRHLQYTDSNPNDLIQNVSLDGPALSYVLHLR